MRRSLMACAMAAMVLLGQNALAIRMPENLESLPPEIRQHFERIQQVEQMHQTGIPGVPSDFKVSEENAALLEALPPEARQAYLYSLYLGSMEPKNPEPAPAEPIASIHTPAFDVPPMYSWQIFDPQLASEDPIAANSQNGIPNNPNPANPFTYTGREDDGNGLYYYRGRYYDPELEIFISPDPYGNGQRYARGNPLKYKDPLRLIDILYNNTSYGHMAILTEPIIPGNDSSRYVYGTGLGQGPITKNLKIVVT